MKIIKFLFFLLLGIVAIWAISTLFSIVTALLPILLGLVILYVIGRITWRIINKKEKKALPLAETRQDLAALAEVERKLAELKQQQKIKQ